MLMLHLIRHGETNWNAERRVQGQSDSVLNSKGQAQAAELRPLIDSLNISAVYSSSNVRTMQTAEILAANLEHEITPVDGLREIRLGEWETQLWEELAEQYPQKVDQFRNHPADFSLEGAETFQQLAERGKAALESIIMEELGAHHSDPHTDDAIDNDVSEKQILVVSHGAILKATLSLYAGVSMSGMWDAPDLTNCSHSILRADADGHRYVERIGGFDPVDVGWPC